MGQGAGARAAFGVVGRPRVTIVAGCFLATTLCAPLAADDLSGSQHFLCSVSEVSACERQVGCERQAPSQLNVPQFIDVDLVAKKLSTTPTSGERRETAVASQQRDAGLIVLQGIQNGRAFSLAIDEPTGAFTGAVASADRGIVVFGACTPLPAAK
jgi:hypothetical protein